MAQPANPLKVPAADDTGAETLRRYRFQAAFAAHLAVGSVEQLSSVAAVYCEHHDDVLIEFHDGLCDAIQVKTQASGVGPLKGNSDAVLKALSRFVSLEIQFASRFRAYHIACITGFYNAGKSTSNLGHCLEQARSCDASASLPKPLKNLVSKIKTPKDISHEIVVATLRKVRLNGHLAKLEDMEQRVRTAIEELPGMASHRVSEVAAAAEAVIELATRAGQATAGTAASDYVAYLDEPDAHAAAAAITAKRLTPEAVKAALDHAVAAVATLRSTTGTSVGSMPVGSSVAHKKMDAGGLPVHSVRLLDDLRSSAEQEISRRLYRDGADKANRDYDHLQVLVGALAEDARLAARIHDGAYGQEMYADLRRRLTEQVSTQPGSTLGLSPELLTGIAAILTELCRVWWTEPFDLEATA